ncbi:MAG TPA: hypothetical protein VHS99_28050 [Chloroflexota bacterium]|nr:hypothetical protein [Chloroflexota bacterium]
MRTTSATAVGTAVGEGGVTSSATTCVVAVAVGVGGSGVLVAVGETVLVAVGMAVGSGVCVGGGAAGAGVTVGGTGVAVAQAPLVERSLYAGHSLSLMVIVRVPPGRLSQMVISRSSGGGPPDGGWPGVGDGPPGGVAVTVPPGVVGLGDGPPGGVAVAV